MARPAMTPVVVEVGPATVRGPDGPPAGWAEAALAAVGDRLTVVEGRVVEVTDVLREVLSATTGGRVRSLALVVPSWWPARWTAVVTDAAGAVTDDVRVFGRGPLLSASLSSTVVEVAADVLAIAEPGRPLRVVGRDELTSPHPELVDIPAGVAVPTWVTGRRIGREDVEAAVAATLTTRPRFHRPALVLGAAVMVASIVPWVLRDPAPPQWRVLTEGRAAIEVPADWAAERITSGPGSARVRVSAPGGLPALHLTQSLGPADLEGIAESLRRAIASAPAGVFVDFRPDGAVGDRAAVTYRELRDGSQTRWAVVGDGNVRIAVGCQSEPGDTDAIAAACARAVRSAHAVAG
ncbi:MAG: type VII secretion-associated protein [Mycobacterium kyogaense]|uniref:type VII secretion-associated protein n=1 Tax=Mycobacterium kyogaense TaxID=2212479 RepID=UPI002FF944FF